MKLIKPKGRTDSRIYDIGIIHSLMNNLDVDIRFKAYPLDDDFYVIRNGINDTLVLMRQL